MSIEKQILYLLSKKKAMESKDIITIFERMDYTPQTIRNTLSKLKKLEYVMTINRSVYTLNPKGFEYITNLVSKVDYYRETWNQT
ncbi:hypothetical protein CJ195_12090 [Bacillus sp. UMB0899]|nr:hypothetical protein CJ195_12090 [Bacillus sp. UMB0899]